MCEARVGSGVAGVPDLTGLRIVLAAALFAGGCTLVDQRTFRGPAPAPTVEDVARAKLPPLPLVVIRFDQPDLDFRPALASAVDAARTRMPDVSFDVLAPIPTSAAPEVQRGYIRQGDADTSDVATALQADGVALEQIHMGFRGDPGSPPREVRIYIR